MLNAKNITSVFGKTNDSRVFDTESESHIFEWLIQEMKDAKGNKISYTYKAENKENVPNDLECLNHSYNNKYIATIKYGNCFLPLEEEKYAFEIIFDYGEYDFKRSAEEGRNPYESIRKWGYRKDSFSFFTSGFEIRTCRLCLNIALFHHFETELGAPMLVKQLALNYTSERKYGNLNLIGPTTLNTAEIIGYRRNGVLATDSYEIQELPPATYKFSEFNLPTQPVFEDLKINGGTIPDYLGVDGFYPVDFNNEGISGLLYTKGNSIMYCEPDGGGEYQFPESVNEFPINRQFENGETTFLDLEGNGELDLLAKVNHQTGFYKRTQGAWTNFEAFQQIPTIYGDPRLEQAVLNNNGKSDLLLVKEGFLEMFPSIGFKGYDAPSEKITPAQFPIVKKGYKEEFVGFTNVLVMDFPIE